MSNKINLVWLKRDLRTQDHEPLMMAEEADLDYMMFYVFEPSLMAYADTSERHLQFIYHAILDIDKTLSPYNRNVNLFHGEAVDVFQWLIDTYDVVEVFSYQESGILKTWDRDKAISQLFEQNKVNWSECQRDGIVRGIRNRVNWDEMWHETMNSQVILNTYSISASSIEPHPYVLPTQLLETLKTYSEYMQPSGERMAWVYLQSFCKNRGRNYQRHISKPTESRMSCGRISPYLAWGNISIRQAYQYVSSHKKFDSHKRPYKQFLTRLHWHCHFIQKFEVECTYEFHCVNPGYELLAYKNDEELLTQWKEGRTGLPLVDACMRCLHVTGWINFRMRAMVVSVLCHHFDCDWRIGVYHLAKLFLDYEPGIHFTQFQMQAGVTGINTIRMYNPIKQSQDHDGDGVFIKKWIPELANCPSEFIHEPWKMTAMERQMNNMDNTYPNPQIDVADAAKKARDKIWGHRSHPEVRRYRQLIIQRHTRNKRFKKRNRSTSA